MATSRERYDGRNKIDIIDYNYLNRKNARDTVISHIAVSRINTEK